MGFIGAGANTASRHLPGFAETGEVEFVAVANRSRESGERVASQFGIARVAESPAATAKAAAGKTKVVAADAARR